MEIIFIILLIAALALYGWGKRANTEYVGCVEAGSTHDACAEELAQYAHYEKRKLILDDDNRPINMQHYLRVMVKGDCLKPLGIEDRSQLLVYKFKNEQEKSSIRNGDILMIHLKDKRIDKVRVFDRRLDDGRMATYRYASNGNRKDSSRPHNVSDVVGIVKYML